MTIDVNAAGVLAQVIPALLVFLALEDRLSPALIPGQKWRTRLMRWREFAVVANLLSLALCLVIVVTKVENFVISLVIAASVAFLLVVLTMLFAGMFGRDDERVSPAVDTTT
ncbi:hypothetical protein [Arthrobacter sp. FW306-2-2C-D06B]|uniref:hypothetical protein n=1 Tax=Arthrobacter sp. FW306-2-2C-D06B TaxID=2879618 RepID=UPI001F36E376|nr:hypothetical protein [Arthrobacter sp. FW306-2-2C-D06B]UKA59185.1 hypothetical protein LFT47_02175 [Arthrobacter sp. FW306-2-2C-D06B]